MTDSYSPEALAKYSLLVKATVAGDLPTVKELLKDESIDIHTLIPAEKYYDLTSAIALAIDNGCPEMIEAFLTHPKIDFNRKIGDFSMKTAGWSFTKGFSSHEICPSFNLINYALLKGNFVLAEELIKEGKCTLTGNDIFVTAHFYLENKQAAKFIKLIAIPNAETLRNLPNNDKLLLISLFRYFNVDIEEVFDICFPSMDGVYDFKFLSRFYLFNISNEWFEKLKQKDMLKHLNVLSSSGTSLITYVVTISLEKAKILYDFGAEPNLNGHESLICAASKRTSEFLQLFPFTEEDFINFFKSKFNVDKLKITQEILNVYPDYKRLITLENVVLNPLKGQCEVQLDLCLHYREELGLKANSKIWLEIIAQIHYDENDYLSEKIGNVLDMFRHVYWREFMSFVQSNKGKLLHLLIEKGHPYLSLSLARTNNINWNVLDEAGNSAFLKLLINPQPESRYFMRRVGGSSLEVQAATELSFLHHPELVFSQFTLDLIRYICRKNKIDMFEPNPSTGETLLDRVLKEKHLDFNTGESLLKSLQCFEKVMSESQAQRFFVICPEYWFRALESDSNVLPPNVWELRDEATGELLIQSAIKSGNIPDSDFIVKNEEHFCPHMELIALSAKKGSEGRNVFWECMLKTDTIKYLHLLKKEAIRLKYIDEEILENALDSESITLLQFAIEELGISPNALVRRVFLLKYLTATKYTITKCLFFDYLVLKGSIVCIEGVSCAFFDVNGLEWIERLLQMRHALLLSTIRIMKKELHEKAEDFSYMTDFNLDKYAIVSHPRFSHHFDVRDKSICLLFAIKKQIDHQSLKNAGADPRCAINSKGETVLHLLDLGRFPDAQFFQDFNITEEDLISKGQALYSPMAHFLDLFSHDLKQCPILALYPKLFRSQITRATTYLSAKQDVILGDSSMCLVCREDYVDADEIIVGACKHAVHYECFNKLGASKCPVCRKKMKVEHSTLHWDSNATNEL